MASTQKVQSSEALEDIFNFLKSGAYPAWQDYLSPGHNRTDARCNFRKRTQMYKLSACQTELLKMIRPKGKYKLI